MTGRLGFERETDMRKPSMFVFAVPSGRSSQFTGRPRPAIETNNFSADLVLRDASQRYDRQMPRPAAVLDAELDDRAWPSSNDRMRCSARQS